MIRVEIGPGLRPQDAERYVEPSRLARWILARRGLNVIDAHSEQLPFKDSSIAHVRTRLVLCSVRDVEASLREIERVLEPGGTYMFEEHVATHGPFGRCQDALTPLQRLIAGNCHLNRDLASSIRSVFPEAEIEEYTSGPPPIRWRIRGVATRTT